MLAWMRVLYARIDSVKLDAQWLKGISNKIWVTWNRGSNPMKSYTNHVHVLLFWLNPESFLMKKVQKSSGSWGELLIYSWKHGSNEFNDFNQFIFFNSTFQSCFKQIIHSNKQELIDFISVILAMKTYESSSHFKCYAKWLLALIAQ